MILRNHGLLAMGGTIAEAYRLLRELMTACEIQVSEIILVLQVIILCIIIFKPMVKSNMYIYYLSIFLSSDLSAILI